MGQIKRKPGLMRLLALLLVLALLLTGCGAPAEDSSAGTPPDSGVPSEDVSAEIPSDSGAPVETGETVSSDKPSAGGSDNQDNSDDSEDVAVSPEDALLLARTGLPQGELIQISEEEAGEISRASASMWKGYVAGPNGEDPLVKSRDWSKYSSSLGQEKLSNREAEFFKRLDKMCLKYLSTSGLDGVKNSNSGNKHTRYKIDGVRFGDLGLSAQEVQDLLRWFAYNNPQYYFLNVWGAWTNDTVYPCIYEFAADGEKRAEITNELFDKLDGWIQTVAASASTDYEKELYANNLICESVIYDHDACDAEDAGDDTAIWICQSLYSSVMLEATVCAGYSKTFTAMMNALNVDTTAGLSTSHAWNVVRCDDGNCYAVDVCWNDTDSNPPYKTDYLNVGEEIMLETNSRKESHTYEDESAAWIPAIAKKNYIPEGQEVPDAPQNIRVTEDEKNRYVTWDAVPNADGYMFTRFRNATIRDTITFCRFVSEPKYEFPKKSPDNSDLLLLELKPGTTYYFGVRSYRIIYNEKIFSEYTEFTITTPADDSSQFAAPTNIHPMSLYISNNIYHDCLGSGQWSYRI